MGKRRWVVYSDDEELEDAEGAQARCAAVPRPKEKHLLNQISFGELTEAGGAHPDASGGAHDGALALAEGAAHGGAPVGGFSGAASAVPTTACRRRWNQLCYGKLEVGERISCAMANLNMLLCSPAFYPAPYPEIRFLPLPPPLPHPKFVACGWLALSTGGPRRPRPTL